MKSVVILGSAHPFRGGGIVTFNERLAREFQQQGYHTTIYNFSVQYPGFLFPGKTQYSDQPPPKDLEILSRLHSMNPLNWLKVGNELKKLAPDLVVVRFWLPLMGPALGTVLRRIKRNDHTKIVAITDNVIPHEKRPGDRLFTRYFLRSCDAFVTMSEQVTHDLGQFITGKPVQQVLHPLYDNFGDAVGKTVARQHLGIDLQDKVLLFFGFIRKYKGLDVLLESLKYINDNNPGSPPFKLLVAGEFYEDEKTYTDLIARLGIGDNLIMRTGFIPDSEVKYFFGAADVVIQPYRHATQSGVTPLAYHFEKPMIVTNVGALASYVPHETVGLVAEPNVQAIGDAIIRYYELGEDYFIPHLRSEKRRYSWVNLVKAIEEVAARGS